MAGKRVCILVLLAFAIGLLALHTTTQTQANTLNPFGSTTLSDSTPGANADVILDLVIPAPSAQFSFEAGLITFYPPGFWFADDSELPNGAGVAEIAPELALAIAGRGCDYDLTGVYFDMYDGDTDIDDVLTAADMAFVNKDAATNPIPDARGEEPTDVGADGIPDYLQGYPYLNNILFDPDGPCKVEENDPTKCELADTGSALPLEPRARMADTTTVQGMNIFLQWVLFNPGQLQQLGGPFAEFGPEMGYPAVTILNNPYELVTEPSTIQDFCTPLVVPITAYGVTQNSCGTTGGADCTVDHPEFDGLDHIQNPEADSGICGTETHKSYTHIRNLRDIGTDLGPTVDSEADGYENYLDTCPFTDSSAWDPRITGVQAADNDGDGIPNDCDQTPNTDTGFSDHDFDGFANRNDNCPQVANPKQDDFSTEDVPGAYATDWGIKGDDIGDRCDDSDGDGNEDGMGAGTCTDAIDNGGVDGDVDGNDIDCTGYEDAGSPTKFTCDDGIDNDGDDTCDTCGCDGMPPDPDCVATGKMDSTDPDMCDGPAGYETGHYQQSLMQSAICITSGGADSDGDGYCDATELALGSDPNDGAEANCANALDDDGDGYVNDGCPMQGGEIEGGLFERGECNEAEGATADDDPNDWRETADGRRDNDGCPTIGTPESLLIDLDVNLPDALPSGSAPQTCSDGIDNDGDTLIDGFDPGCGMKKFHLENPLLQPPSTDPLVLSSPVSTQWNELWPKAGADKWHLVSWTDNTDSVLSPSDYVDMQLKPSGAILPFHVDEVTITIVAGSYVLEYEDGFDTMQDAIDDPVGTQWLRDVPLTTFGERWYLLSIVDNGDGVLSASDTVTMMKKDPPGQYTEITEHVDEVTIDFIGSIVPNDIDQDGKADPVEKKMHNVEPPYPVEPPTVEITDPVSSLWHELWPTYSQYWHLTSWHDNGDLVLSPSDLIDMTFQDEDGDDIGWPVWYHVKDVTVTLWVTPKVAGEPMYIEFEIAPWWSEPAYPFIGAMLLAPTGTWWHEDWPVQNQEWQITFWNDNGDSYISASDQIILEGPGPGSGEEWHVAEVAVDLLLEGYDNCEDAYNPSQEDYDGDGEGDVCDDNDDDDQIDAHPTQPIPAYPFPDELEYALGSDPLDACPTVCDEHYAWPPDHVPNRDLGVTDDVFAYRGNIGKSPSAECAGIEGENKPTCKVRQLDLKPNNDIGVTDDVFAYRGHIADKCEGGCP